MIKSPYEAVVGLINPHEKRLKEACQCDGELSKLYYILKNKDLKFATKSILTEQSYEKFLKEIFAPNSKDSKVFCKITEYSTCFAHMLVQLARIGRTTNVHTGHYALTNHLIYLLKKYENSTHPGIKFFRGFMFELLHESRKLDSNLFETINPELQLEIERLLNISRGGAIKAKISKKVKSIGNSLENCEFFWIGLVLYLYLYYEIVSTDTRYYPIQSDSLHKFNQNIIERIESPHQSSSDAIIHDFKQEIRSKKVSVIQGVNDLNLELSNNIENLDIDLEMDEMSYRVMIFEDQNGSPIGFKIPELD